jgi:hypothetical protein
MLNTERPNRFYELYLEFYESNGGLFSEEAPVLNRTIGESVERG